MNHAIQTSPQGAAPAADAATEGAASFTRQPWSTLRQFTDARIALGRAGQSLPTAAHLQFQWAHAQARDAVHIPLDVPRIETALQAAGMQTLALHSAAPDRRTYLQRPDWGRRLDEASGATLQHWRAQQPKDTQPDVCIVVADGLSPLAIHSNAVEFVRLLRERLQHDSPSWNVAPVCVVQQGRVAVGDDIGQRLAAKLVIVLIGERPGLSSPDSMGIYLTWAPQVGCTDAQRNCISNVRSAGLPLPDAVHKLHALMRQARTLQLTGVGLKDDMPDALAE
jgi:ethanolamine ammonia-lyase small subunit